MPRVTDSDHGSFQAEGYPGILINDTNFLRYPHYHQSTDTIEHVDFERLARLTAGVARMIWSVSMSADIP